MSNSPFELTEGQLEFEYEQANADRLPGVQSMLAGIQLDTDRALSEFPECRRRRSCLYGLTPSTSPCVTRIVRGQPCEGESRTQ